MFKKITILALAVIATLNIGLSQSIEHKGDVKNITLEQTKGEFSVKELTLTAGTYQFEIVNNNVGADVGFVLAPEDTPDQHIKEA